ncbi:hypothetical protein NE647_15645 [Blautia coccoides]|uniref:hypothetical protein n=1 Tax=Blautia producta TaxID=33035 RepID=UPI00210C7287|nr:hypothetical protein [Blautia coccoides]MCQ4641847.1 hypothetical protein [Blautia coccoides]
MDEKKIYAVYVDLLRMHKEFCKKEPVFSEREIFIQRINAINLSHNSYFCYLMCEALRKWFLKKFTGITDTVKFYSELWHFHKEYLSQSISELEWGKIVNEADKLSDMYGIDACNEMVLAIITDLDSRIKQTGE